MDSRTYKAAVAESVRAAMEKAGCSKLSVAEGTGIPRATLTRRLDGHSPFNVDELDSIAKFLGLDPADFTAIHPVAVA